MQPANENRRPASSSGGSEHPRSRARDCTLREPSPASWEARWPRCTASSCAARRSRLTRGARGIAGRDRRSAARVRAALRSDRGPISCPDTGHAHAGRKHAAWGHRAPGVRRRTPLGVQIIAQTSRNHCARACISPPDSYHRPHGRKSRHASSPRRPASRPAGQRRGRRPEHALRPAQRRLRCPTRGPRPRMQARARTRAGPRPGRARHDAVRRACRRSPGTWPMACARPFRPRFHDHRSPEPQHARRARAACRSRCRVTAPDQWPVWEPGWTSMARLGRGCP